MKKKILPGEGILINMYKKMYEIRTFEEKLYYLFVSGIMPGTMHQYTGQEAIAAGVCENLRKDDYVTSTHRGHGHCIAKEADINKMMAEMFAKRTGTCKGMGGSMHLADFSVGMLGANGIVGAGIPIAVGAGLSIKLRGSEQVAVSFFGEGAVNQGAFHEGVNLSAIWKLPVIFICENNLYAVSTHIKDSTLIQQVSARASAYGIPGITVDGNDVLAVYESAKEALERARDDKGPTLIECLTYRQRGHARFDPAQYRPKEEEKEWLGKDPITRFKNLLINWKVISQKEIGEVEKEIEIRIENAVEFATRSQDVNPDEVMGLVYA